MRIAQRWIGYSIASVASVTLHVPVHAQMTGNAIEVGGRVASFLQPGLSGTVTAAVIYEPGDEVSEREARTIERELAGGARVGTLSLRPRRVAANALGELAGVRIAFITRGTNYRQVTAAAAARSILTISSDPACARAGLCAVAIQSAPRVQIYVSRTACAAARLRFSAAFLMLVREI